MIDHPWKVPTLENTTFKHMFIYTPDGDEDNPSSLIVYKNLETGEEELIYRRADFQYWGA